MSAHETRMRYFLYALSTFTVVILSLLLIAMPQKATSQVVTQDSLDEDISYWKAVIDENPTYRDGFVILSMLLREKGEDLLAHEYMQRVYEIDPYFELNKEYYSSVLGVSSEDS